MINMIEYREINDKLMIYDKSIFDRRYMIYDK